MTFDKERKPVELNHKVKLLGTNSPLDFFTITCSPEGTQCSDIILSANALHSNCKCLEYVERPARVVVGKSRQLEENKQPSKYVIHSNYVSGSQIPQIEALYIL